MEEESVIVRFQYGLSDLKPLHQLEDKLEMTLDEFEGGEYDGNEIAVNLSDGLLYFYGANAEQLFETIEPILRSTDFLRGAKVSINGKVERELAI